ncbi:MAG: response regulator [Planctomycetota bacterium]
MLLFERKNGEGFSIGGLARVRVTGFRGNGRVKLAIDAPRHVPVLRDEVTPRDDAPAPQFEALHVLMVEDDDDFCTILESVFELHAVGKITRASSPEQALEKLDQLVTEPNPPSLILIDFHLLGGTGCELVEKLRARGDTRRLPLVMLSGSDDEENIEACFEAGASAYLRKPDDFAGLSEVVGRLLNFWVADDVLR